MKELSRPLRHTLPSEAEVVALPRWARVAFAARCAQRVLPNYSGHPAERDVLSAIVDTAFESADAATMTFKLGDPAAAWWIAESSGLPDNSPNVRIARSVANARWEAERWTGHNAYWAAADSLVADPEAIVEIRSDFNLLLRASVWRAWTNETPVERGFFECNRHYEYSDEAPIVQQGRISVPVEAPVILPAVRPRPQAGDPVPHMEMWVLEEMLGQGGFGEVWLARKGCEQRAVKFCTHALARDRLTDATRHEANVVRHVEKHMKTSDGSHPNIVPLLDCNLTGGQPWMMYEYVSGGRTLADEIKELAALPMNDRVARAIRLMRIITAAVGGFHRIPVPIVHRDLKPRNVLMAGTVPRITDFGIGGEAVIAAISDATGGFTELSVDLPTVFLKMGTLPHASPEQLAGEKPDPRDDVYALGVMIHQMLVGKATAEAKGAWQRPLRRDGVPEPLIELIEDCTSERDHRPADAAALAAELAELFN